jgi:hypothetical protein
MSRCWSCQAGGVRILLSFMLVFFCLINLFTAAPDVLAVILCFRVCFEEHPPEDVWRLVKPADEGGDTVCEVWPRTSLRLPKAKRSPGPLVSGVRGIASQGVNPPLPPQSPFLSSQPRFLLCTFPPPACSPSSSRMPHAHYSVLPTLLINCQ